ncbi:MAG: glycoside hydrolase family 10 protein [Candidatus Hydrogenedentota bacterium]
MMIRFRTTTQCLGLIAVMAAALMSFPVHGAGEPLDLHAIQWDPMGDTAPAEKVDFDGVNGVRLPCNLEGADSKRASWDAEVELDLSGASGLEIEMRCADPGPISSLSVYMQSGDGWYRATAELPGEDWTTLRIRRENTGIEAEPAGWSQISTVRLSAWRGADQDTRMDVRSMRVVPAEGTIGVLRTEAAVAAGQGGDTVSRQVERICAMLGELGLKHQLVSDLEPEGLPLTDLDLLIMPYTPDLPAEIEADIVRWVEDDGGRVLAFYHLPNAIAEAGGLRPGQYIGQEQPGHFAAIVPTARLQGAPERAAQPSWNITVAEPAADDARVLAGWQDESGEDLDMPAIAGSPRLVHMTHVMLPEDAAAKQQLLLAMLGYLDEGVWRDAAEGMLARVGVVAGYAGLADMRAGLSEPRALEALDQAEGLVEEAEGHMEQGAFLEAIALMREGEKKATEAFAKNQTPAAGEWRGFWRHQPDGVGGEDWDTAIQRLAENGFTAILPNMLWGGLAYYPSEVLPQAEEVKEGRDFIAECLEACQEHGVELHVWKVNWNMGNRAPAEFVERMRAEERLMVNFDGSEESTWLCPSHPDNQQLEIDAMLEVAANYDVDGVHFDYIRYPGAHGCFCDGCRERFEERLGEEVANWPEDTRDDPEVREAWLQFRRDQITAVVAEVAEGLQEHHPDVQLSASVFSNWNTSPDSIGQDAELWCEQGYLDFLCPMNYTPHNHVFARQTSTQIGKAHGVPVYPGIGLSTWPGMQRDAVKLIEQIRLARESGAPGFTVFEYDQSAMIDVLPMAGMGITRAE